VGKCTYLGAESSCTTQHNRTDSNTSVDPQHPTDTAHALTPGRVSSQPCRLLGDINASTAPNEVGKAHPESSKVCMICLKDSRSLRHIIVRGLYGYEQGLLGRASPSNVTSKTLRRT
jgi:hypothetical protein